MEKLNHSNPKEWSAIIKKTIKKNKIFTVKMGNGDVLTMYSKKGHPDLIMVEGSVFPMSGEIRNIVKDLLQYNDLIRLRQQITTFVNSDYNRNGGN